MKKLLLLLMISTVLTITGVHTKKLAHKSQSAVFTMLPKELWLKIPLSVKAEHSIGMYFFLKRTCKKWKEVLDSPEAQKLITKHIKTKIESLDKEIKIEEEKRLFKRRLNLDAMLELFPTDTMLRVVSHAKKQKIQRQNILIKLRSLNTKKNSPPSDHLSPHSKELYILKSEMKKRVDKLRNILIEDT